MTGDDTEYRNRKHGRYFLIPAGVLIGLGVGLLAGYPGSGVLIGLGLGFLGSAFMKLSGNEKGDTPLPVQARRPRWTFGLIGIFLIVIGIGITWAPANRWPLLIAIFLILFGLWFIVRNFLKRS